MLNIEILNGNDDDSLELEVNGNPSNGNNRAKKNSQVHWKVRSGPASNVLNIESIKIKRGPGAPSSTNIFSRNPPAAQDPHGFHWKAIVDSTAPNFAEYHYEINWVKKGDTHVRTWDPIISIMPSTTVSRLLLVVGMAVAFLLSFFCISLLLKKKNRK